MTSGNKDANRRGGVEVGRSHGEIGFRSQVATDLSRKNR